MTTALYLAEHAAFILWFAKRYPQLHKMHGMDILPAIDETGFIINSGNMDKEMHRILLQITNDYHYLDEGR